MAKKKVLEVCPVYKTSEILDGKWTILIFRDLLALKVVRFNELRRSLGAISPKTLTERLTFLELQGLVERKAYARVRNYKPCFSPTSPPGGSARRAS